MFDVGPDDRGRSFGPQRERPVLVAIGERVHLLGDDIRFFTHTAAEEFSRFEYWCTDFPKTVRMKNVAQAALDGMPDFDLAWKQVVCAFYCVNHNQPPIAPITANPLAKFG